MVFDISNEFADCGNNRKRKFDTVYNVKLKYSKNRQIPGW